MWLHQNLEPVLPKGKYCIGNGAKPKKRKRPNAAEQTVRIIDLDEPGYANKAVKVARKKLDLATFMEQGDDEEDDGELDSSQQKRSDTVDAVQKSVKCKRSSRGLVKFLA